mmetsp:Transcript_57833/g.95933  ORF Transcript_57833/g.95933 Transcript_57833/m.95933 type:complete len:201 (+) Transcript_57833:196-798(+)
MFIARNHRINIHTQFINQRLYFLLQYALTFVPHHGGFLFHFIQSRLYCHHFVVQLIVACLQATALFVVSILLLLLQLCCNLVTFTAAHTQILTQFIKLAQHILYSLLIANLLHKALNVMLQCIRRIHFINLFLNSFDNLSRSTWQNTKFLHCRLLLLLLLFVRIRVFLSRKFHTQQFFDILISDKFYVRFPRIKLLHARF